MFDKMGVGKCYFFPYFVEKRRILMDNSALWGYIDQLEALAQGILDLTAELHQETGPRIPLSDTLRDPAVVPPKQAGMGVSA